MNQASTTQPSATEFAPDAGGTEATSANLMLVMAYMALWLVLFAFVAVNWRRQRALSERLTDVERTLASRDPTN
jgi:hypothetical protein